MITRTKQRLAAAALMAAFSAPLITTGGPVAAQTDGRLDLVAQTLFVDENPAQIVLRVNGAPDDARLQFRIFDDPQLTRSAVRASHDNPPTSGSRIANFECTLTGDCSDQALFEQSSSGLITITLLDELLGEELRRRDGALPFVITLRSEDGEPLDHISTSLVILNDAPATTNHVAFVSDLSVDVAHRADGSVTIDAPVLLERAEVISSRARIPIAVDLQPETLAALTVLDPEAGAELADVLLGRELLHNPWVSMDEEGWRSIDQGDRVVEQYTLGRETFEELIGAGPTTITAIDADATADTLALLRSVGTTAIVVEDDHLASFDQERSPNQPVQTLDANGVAMTALRYDQALHTTLSESDAELSAYRALAELSIAARANDTNQASLLNLDSLDQDAVDLLVSEIGLRPELSLASITDFVNLPHAQVGGRPVRIKLAGATPPDLSGRGADLEAAMNSINTLAAMLDPELDAIEPLDSLLLAAVADSLEPAEAATYIDAVFSAVLTSTSGFEVVESARITLTDRRTDLPLTIVNNQPVVMNVEVILSAEKIRFPDGDRLLLRLRPGDNPQVIRVETLASGDARVTAQVVAPGGELELARGSVDIRSTAISGLGLVISIVALLVLGAWWIRTILRVRRNRTTATVSAASNEGEL